MYIIIANQGRTRPECNGGRGLVFPIACGPFPHGIFGVVIQQGTNVAGAQSKARFLVTVQSCTRLVAFMELVRRSGANIRHAPRTESLATVLFVRSLSMWRSRQLLM